MKKDDLWYRSTNGYLAGRGPLDDLDKIAWEMDRKWGTDALRLLVSPELRAAFDRQRVKVNKASAEGTLGELKEEVAKAITAWQFLDKAATEAKKTPIEADFFELGEIGNTVAVIVRAGTKFKQQDDRGYTVYTDEEIVRMLEVWNGVHAVKELWPGAEVTAARLPKDPLLRAFDEEAGDDLPSNLMAG